MPKCATPRGGVPFLAFSSTGRARIPVWFITEVFPSPQPPSPFFFFPVLSPSPSHSSPPRFSPLFVFDFYGAFSSSNWRWFLAAAAAAAFSCSRLILQVFHSSIELVLLILVEFLPPPIPPQNLQVLLSFDEAEMLVRKSDGLVPAAAQLVQYECCGICRRTRSAKKGSCRKICYTTKQIFVDFGGRGGGGRRTGAADGGGGG